jgi:hypothetical protein
VQVPRRLNEILQACDVAKQAVNDEMPNQDTPYAQLVNDAILPEAPYVSDVEELPELVPDLPMNRGSLHFRGWLSVTSRPTSPQSVMEDLSDDEAPYVSDDEDLPELVPVFPMNRGSLHFHVDLFVTSHPTTPQSVMEDLSDDEVLPELV